VKLRIKKLEPTNLSRLHDRLWREVTCRAPGLRARIRQLEDKEAAVVGTFAVPVRVAPPRDAAMSAINVHYGWIDGGAPLRIKGTRQHQNAHHRLVGSAARATVRVAVWSNGDVTIACDEPARAEELAQQRGPGAARNRPSKERKR
jgi:hypothetical protein